MKILAPTILAALIIAFTARAKQPNILFVLADDTRHE